MEQTETILRQRTTFEESDNLKHHIQHDVLAADLQLSLFIGASQSFKYESLLKPVPAYFKKPDGEVDIDKLRRLISQLPSLNSFLKNDYGTSQGSIISLLKTALFNSSYKLTSIPINNFNDNILQSIELKVLPRWTFQVDYSQARQESWDRWKSDRDVFLAFHGSRFENFHSILNLGLHQHLNKTALFGEGIYLSTEQTLSMHYSPSGAGWSSSQLGEELSVLALCEVIDHPDVKRKIQPNERWPYKTRSESVPEKYILVTNNELVRPRYLLVYTRPKVQKKNSVTFWHRYKFMICIGVYLVLLLVIGLAKRSAP